MGAALLENTSSAKVVNHWRIQRAEHTAVINTSQVTILEGSLGWTCQLISEYCVHCRSMSSSTLEGCLHALPRAQDSVAGVMDTFWKARS